MQKNVAGQKWRVFAYDRTTQIPKTGDAANITAVISIDGAAAGATNDVNPTELSGGFYEFSLTQAETNGSELLIIASSVTSSIQVIGAPATVTTTPISWPTDIVQTGDAFARIGAAGASLTSIGDTRIANLDALISSRLAPTVSGRTLDVTTTGEAGIDWSNVSNPSTTLNLSGTTIASVSSLGVNAIDADSIAADAKAEIADGVWEEPTAGHTTAGTYGGRIMRSTNSNVEVQITGSNHIAADVHEFQTAVIVAGAFAADAITAAALAADAVTEIQSGLATSAEVAAEAVKTANILDGVAWILADATGAIAAPQSETATAILTTFGATYTVQYAGLTSTGVRTAPTLTKV